MEFEKKLMEMQFVELEKLAKECSEEVIFDLLDKKNMKESLP